MLFSKSNLDKALTLKQKSDVLKKQAKELSDKANSFLIPYMQDKGLKKIKHDKYGTFDLVVPNDSLILDKPLLEETLLKYMPKVSIKAIFKKVFKPVAKKPYIKYMNLRNNKER